MLLFLAILPLVYAQICKFPISERQEQFEKQIKSFGANCNFTVSNPKKIINPFKERMDNYVETKPFGSLCMKCDMCLAVAKEMDDIFKETSATNRYKNQQNVVQLLNEKIKNLCLQGFENYDLRKFEHYQIVTDKFKCSLHIKSNMDGKWTEKLREICLIYSDHMNVQQLLNDYLKGENNISHYLCRSSGIFRDCSSLTALENSQLSTTCS